MANPLPTHVDVLIVGAGPVGMSLALALHRAGVQAMLIDRHAEGLNTSRAAVIHARTLEVLQPLGVTQDLIDQGIPCRSFRVREQGRVLLGVDLSDLPSDYRYALMCPQDQTEAVLRAHLDREGIRVERPVRLRSLQEGDGRMLAVLQPGEGPAHEKHETHETHETPEVHEVLADWVVGCDGARSTVRESAGIDFEGGDYEESFVLADVRMDWPIGRDEVSLFLSPQGLMVVAPLPGDRFRIVATEQHPAGQPAFDDVQRLLDERGVQAPAGILREVLWSSDFHLQHRVASQVFKGRVLLCGDAAHVHSPAGGQGMNTGIQDAVALAGPLSLALRTGARDGLSQWATERQRVAHQVVGMTDAMTRLATLDSKLLRATRDAALGLIGHLPFATHRIAVRLAELDH